jgi:hypothetical protein
VRESSARIKVGCVQQPTPVQRHGTSLKRSVIVGASLLVGACQLTLDNPAPPETSELEEVYDSPPGRLAAPALHDVTAAFEEQSELLRETDSLSVVGGLLDAVSTNEAVVEKGDEVDPTSGARVLAVAKVTRVCRGPVGDDVIDAERFGVVRMTAKGSGKGIFPTAWGRFENCVEHTESGRPLTINGDYSITLHQSENGKNALFIFRGTIESSEVSFDGDFDFRVLSNGTTELRVTGADGDVVVALSARGQLIARDEDGIWTCDPVALTCENMRTGETISAEPAP